MKKYLEKNILGDLPTKIVLLSGPRQCGKTTCAKSLYPNYDYLNYNTNEERALLQKNNGIAKKLVIFDELHKMKKIR